MARRRSEHTAWQPRNQLAEGVWTQRSTHFIAHGWHPIACILARTHCLADSECMSRNEVAQQLVGEDQNERCLTALREREREIERERERHRERGERERERERDIYIYIYIYIERDI